MRILLLVLVSLVLLSLGVVVIGWLLPKRHIVSRRASYRAGADRLFSLISGPQDWRPNLARSEVMSDAAGRELLRETMRDGQMVTYEVLERRPPVSLKRRIATENLPYSGTWTYSLQPNGEATIVRITEDGEVDSPLFRFISRFVFGHTRSLDEYLHALGKATGEEVQITD